MNIFLAFPSMLIVHMGEDHGIDIPEDTHAIDMASPGSLALEFPHWYVFVKLHICRPVDTDHIAHNAKIIGSLTTEEIKKFTFQDFIDKGLIYDVPDTLV